MNYMDKVAEMLGVELNEKFKIKEAPSTDFMLDSNGLYASSREGEVFWRDADYQLQLLLSGRWTIEKWPQKGDLYFYPDFADSEPFQADYWRGDEEEMNIKKRVGVYKTREDALQKAKELGWIE